jgi:dienelactone hydrolase
VAGEVEQRLPLHGAMKRVHTQGSRAIAPPPQEHTMKRCVIGLLVSLALGVVGCAQSVRFPSASTLHHEMLTARLYRPRGDGPFPAMVLLHGCSGLSEHYERWAAWLTHEGYATLVVDSFFARHISNICGPQGRMTLSVSDRVWDALGALAYLQSLPLVDRDRIGVMGWSHGGSTALRASATRLQPPGGGFQIAVAFYPGCSSNLASDSMPVLLLLGEVDDWSPAAPCVELAQQVQRAGVSVQWIVYSGAYHAFDVPRPGRMYVGHYLQYSPQAADDAQARVRAFLAQHLGAGVHP